VQSAVATVWAVVWDDGGLVASVLDFQDCHCELDVPVERQSQQQFKQSNIRFTGS
jgi:hypothetical protein